MIQARSRRRMPIVMPATVHIRRSYAECRYGQLHVATAYPSGGGFDERTPLLCLHASGSSARMFAPQLPELGRDRSVYALDLPGHGSSDRANTELSVADYANAIADFVDTLRLRTIDIVGAQLGALAAAEFAIARPQHVRRIVMTAVPCVVGPERHALLGRAASTVPMEDGSHLTKEWQRLKDSRGINMSLDVLTDQLADALRATRAASAANAAVFDYASAQRLALVKQPVLLLRPRDELWDHGPRVKQTLPHATMVDLPEYGSGLFSSATQTVASMVREFLDR